ncbi:MAG: pyrimidine reductase family protein [Micromonosporaceae bacterium]
MIILNHDRAGPGALQLTLTRRCAAGDATALRPRGAPVTRLRTPPHLSRAGWLGRSTSHWLGCVHDDLLSGRLAYAPLPCCQPFNATDGAGGFGGTMSQVRILQAGAMVTDALAPYADVSRARADGGCWVMANMVGGLDGSAAIGGRVAALSTPPDAELFILMRALADVVLVGAETVRREGYRDIRLPAERALARQAAGRTRTPRLAVVTRSLELDWSGSAFAGAPAESRSLVITCKAADARRVERARHVADVVIAGEERVDVEHAVLRLSELGARVVLCEGGPTLLGELVSAGRLDELCLTIAPVMGGDPLPVSVSPPGVPPRHFTLRHVLRDGDTLFLRYEQGHNDR